MRNFEINSVSGSHWFVMFPLKCSSCIHAKVSWHDASLEKLISRSFFLLFISCVLIRVGGKTSHYKSRQRDHNKRDLHDEVAVKGRRRIFDELCSVNIPGSFDFLCLCLIEGGIYKKLLINETSSSLNTGQRFVKNEVISQKRIGWIEIWEDFENLYLN